jgi:hypothetical protein
MSPPPVALVALPQNLSAMIVARLPSHLFNLVSPFRRGNSRHGCPRICSTS